MGLLSQKINNLGLTTAKEKLNAINLLQYLLMVIALKYYLGLTDYFCSYIYYYAQLVKLLQIIKIAILKTVFIFD